MKIIEPSYEILTPISSGGKDELQRIEKIARVCYKSEDRITEDGESAKKMLRMLIERGHEAIIEHSSLSVKFIVDRGISHELVRHRIASFAQESTRYCNYSKDKFDNNVTFINPAGGFIFEKLEQFPINGEYAVTAGEISAGINPIEFQGIWKTAMEEAEYNYLKAIEKGANPQMARSILPNSVKTEISITANYREWRNIFKLRTAKPAHPQMRQVMIPLCLELQKLLPVIFDDINIPTEDRNGTIWSSTYSL